MPDPPNVFDKLVAPLPDEGRAAFRDWARVGGEPRSVVELFALLRRRMIDEGFGEGRGGYPGGRGKPGWTDYVDRQRRHLAIFHALVVAFGGPAPSVADAFRDDERSFPPTIRRLGEGYEAQVDEVAGRLIYIVPVESGMVTASFAFPIHASALAVLTHEPYRRAVLEVVAHAVLQRSMTRSIPEVTEREFTAMCDRVLHAAPDVVAGYAAAIGREHHLVDAHVRPLLERWRA